MSAYMTRNVALRGFALAKPRAAPIVTSITSRRFVSTDKDDLGGPGGQDPPPKDGPGITQDRNSLVFFGGAALIIGGLIYITAKPRKASSQDIKKEIENNAAKAANVGEKAKAQIKGIHMDELSGRNNKTPGERGLGAHRAD